MFNILLIAAALQVQPAVGRDTAARRDTGAIYQHRRMSITEVLNAHTSEWMKVRGVIGTGEGRTKAGAPCIIIFAAKKSSEQKKKIPKEIEGYPVRIEVTGTVKAE